MLDKFKFFNQKLSPEFKRIFSSIGWLSFERIFMMALSFFVGIKVIQYLGPENYGKLSYSISFAGLIGSIAKLGLDRIVVRNLVRAEDSTEEILGTAFLLKSLGSFITVFLIGILIWIFNNDSQIRWMTIIISTGLIFTAFETIDFWFQSKVLSKSMAIVRSLQLILTGIAKLILVFGNFPLIAFAWVFMSEFTLKALGMVIVYYRTHQSMVRWKVKRSIAVDLLKDSWPLILSGVMILIYMKIDQVMLGNMTGDEAVGTYAAAVKLSEPCYFVAGAVCTSTFPALIKIRQKSQQAYQSRIQMLYDLMAWLSIIIAIGVTFASDIVATNLLGADFEVVGKILALHIWASPFVFLGIARARWLMAENYTRFNLFATSLGAISNICLNLVLIPEYQAIGAAIATVVSYAISSHISCLFYPPIYDNSKMLFKALIIPFRIRQNLTYIRQIKKTIS